MSNGITKGNRPKFGGTYEDSRVDNPQNRHLDKFEPSKGDYKKRMKSREVLDEMR